MTPRLVPFCLVNGQLMMCKKNHRSQIFETPNGLAQFGSVESCATTPDSYDFSFEVAAT